MEVEWRARTSQSDRHRAPLATSLRRRRVDLVTTAWTVPGEAALSLGQDPTSTTAPRHPPRAQSPKIWGPKGQGFPKVDDQSFCVKAQWPHQKTVNLLPEFKDVEMFKESESRI